MGLRIARDDARQRVILTVRGVVGAALFERGIRELRLDETRTYGALWDLREVSLGEGRGDLTKIRSAVLALDQRQPRPGPVALVVDDASVTLANAYTLMTAPAGYKIRVFRSLEQADDWITQMLAVGQNQTDAIDAGR